MTNEQLKRGNELQKLINTLNDQIDIWNRVTDVDNIRVCLTGGIYANPMTIHINLALLKSTTLNNLQMRLNNAIKEFKNL